MAYVGDGFEIESRWKEEVVYWEVDQGFLFDAGWGVTPGVLYVPSAEIWVEVMPDWLRYRRDEVVARLRQHSEHVLEEDVHGYYRNRPADRLVSR
ncbi:MAG: hypothetical protein ACTHMS_16720 [Jatrophihabitans sp.]|uniref:hypothetical protein n=1 Tax=Jatrophihabitans sp. TaxID=1932789 RepID=UPI003F7FE8C0